MHTRSTTVSPALKALLANLIDYAGLFPPAALSLDESIAKYNKYMNEPYAWMLNRFVIASSDVDSAPPGLAGHLAVLGETAHKSAASIESKGVLKTDKPVYCEVSVTDLDQLDAVKKSGCFAKVRTGGVKPAGIPSPALVAAFIARCAQLRLPFKATAGLHHPIRAEYALTYEPDAPRAVMHGFLNVLLASALAWNGDSDLEPVLAETDVHAFSFDECAHWRNKALTVAQIVECRRNFFHSIGSCSFEEPVHELQLLGLI